MEKEFRDFRERNLKIAELYSQGVPSKVIGEMFGISYCRATLLAKKYGVDTKRKKIFTEEEEKEIIRLYVEEELTTAQIAERMGKSGEHCIQDICRKAGVNRPRGRKTIAREDCFSKIDDERSAYLLGLFTADGCVHERKNIISFGLSDYDGYLVEEMADFMGYKDHVHTYHRNDGGRERDTTTFSANSKQMKNDLIRLGCPVRKSQNLSFIPDIDPTLMRHYVRGFFDGNGTVYFSPKTVLHFGFFSTPTFVRNLYNLMVNYGIVPDGRKVTDKKGVSTIMFSAKKDIDSFYHWIYDDATLFCKRKKEKFDSYFQ